MSHSSFRMRWICILAGLLLAALLLSACTQASLSQSQADLVSQPASSKDNAPTVPADPTAVSTDPVEVLPTASTETGLTYQLDPGLASSSAVESLPAVAGTPDSPYWLPAPETRRVTLSGYPVAKHTFQPQIFIYPVEEFKSANPAAAQVIDRLQTLLQSPQEMEELPFLPVLNARQVIHAHLQSLDFQNGKGVRYLAQFDQGKQPINNRELIYTFQGLTSDGKYYVAAVLPVTHPSLPADELVTGQEPQEFTGDFPQYLADAAARLNAQSADTFTPDLAKLDALMASLKVQ